MKASRYMIMLLSVTLLSTICFAQNETGLLDLLKTREFEKLESAVQQVQSDFETGALTDIELRNIYAQFYALSNETIKNLQEWKEIFPSSYAAHLIRGAYFTRKGFDARGRKHMTPADVQKEAQVYHDIAKTELAASLKLTQKPFLSVFHLLEMSEAEGDKKTSAELLENANKMLPNNTLARNRYLRGLEPRWGGSYEQMKEFVAKSQAEGLAAVGIMQLEAIMYDDMGFNFIESGKKQVATEYFSKALELAERIGGEFRKEYLKNSNYYGCLDPALNKYCQ